MKVQSYQECVKRTNVDLGSDKLNIAHMALGIASELAEIVECVTKKDIDLTNLEEEIGDGFWYGFNYANIRNIEILDNIFDIEFSHGDLNDITQYGGELADIAKRLLAYGQSFEAQEEKRHSCSKKFFMTEEEILNKYLNSLGALAKYNGLNPEVIMGKNITKLYIRYKDKFSEDAALVRDLEAERLVLEQTK
jgi:NTP pyrophosphatase (non-canonical NTP hydrolase)